MKRAPTQTLRSSIAQAAAALALATLSTACVVGEDAIEPSAETEKSLEDHVRGNFIVVLREDSGSSASFLATDVMVDLDITVERTFDVVNAHTFRGSAEDASNVSLRPEVAYVEPDRIMALGVPGFCNGFPIIRFAKKTTTMSRPPIQIVRAGATRFQTIRYATTAGRQLAKQRRGA